jgi:hypothetical protein
MAADSDWDLEPQDVVLRFEIWCHDANHGVEGGFWVCGDESWVTSEELGKARSREGTFGGDVKGRAGEALWGGELGGE